MNLRNRLSRVGLCLTLLLTLGAWVAATAAPVAAHPDSCDAAFDHQHQVAGNRRFGTADPNRGVQAIIDPKEDSFRVCSHGNSNQGGALPDAVSAWVMLNRQSGPQAFVQVGIVRCNYSGGIFGDPSHCDTGGNDNGTEAHFFYQSYGCGQSEPNTVNLGDADFLAHEYALYEYNGTIYAAIDGVVEYSTNVSSSERLSCWLDGTEPVEARWACEAWDGGDLCAHSVDKLNFNNTKFAEWSHLGWSFTSFGEPCDIIVDSNALDSQCDVVSGNDFNIWQNHN